MSLRLRSAIEYALTPFIYLLLFGVLCTAWRILSWPSPTELLEISGRLFDEYGIIVVFFAALTEGIVWVNAYVPGSVVIFVGVAAAKPDIGRVIGTVAIVWIGLSLSAQINYAIGVFGLHRLLARLGATTSMQRAHNWYMRYGWLAVLGAYLTPLTGAFVAVSAGIAGMGWRRFCLLSVGSIGLWCTAWGFVAYLFADTAIKAASEPGVVLSGLATWVVVSFVYGAIRSPVDEAGKQARTS